MNKTIWIIVIAILTFLGCYFGRNTICSERIEEGIFGGGLGDFICGAEITFQTEEEYVNYVLQKITDSQTDYIKTHDKYWQGLPTHSVLPADGKKGKPDKLKSKPEYREESWKDLGLDIDIQMPFSIKVNEHYKPTTNEKGYTVQFHKMVGGKEYIKSVGYGIASQFTRDWQEIIKYEYEF